MRRAGIYVIGLVLVATAIVAVFLAAKDSKSHDDKTAVQPTSGPQVSKDKNKACQIFTATEAKALLGGNVTGGQDSVLEPSADLDVSTCSYMQSSNSAASVSDRKSASLLVRVPDTDKGVTSNNNEFGPLKPTTVQDVAGYGDHAYWDAEHGQLNILKNNNWYILSYGPVSPAGRSLQQTQQMADLLIDKL